LELGKVESYLREKIRSEGAIHLTLIDPEKANPEEALEIARAAERAGSSAILLGGSTIASQSDVDSSAKAIKDGSVKIPIILFPGNLTGISKYADAIFFMSLLNSANPYFLIDVQAMAAPLIRRLRIEAIPLGYVILGSGGAAGYVGYARPIPYRNPRIALSYALAAQYLGMRLVYLEAGSGAEEPIPPNVISEVRKAVDIPLIVGGGIKNGKVAARAVKAGADIIVTGTIVEESSRVEAKIKEIVKAIRASRRRS